MQLEMGRGEMSRGKKRNSDRERERERVGLYHVVDGSSTNPMKFLGCWYVQETTFYLYILMNSEDISIW